MKTTSTAILNAAIQHAHDLDIFDMVDEAFSISIAKNEVRFMTRIDSRHIQKLHTSADKAGIELDYTETRQTGFLYLEDTFEHEGATVTLRVVLA